MKTISLIVFTYIYSCSIAQPVISMYKNNEQKIDSFFKAIYSDTLPGASVAVVNNGRIVFQNSYGIINTATKEKITASSNFNIASLTKQFTALAILQLEEKRQLSLDDKLSRFFPGMNKKVADAVTVKELLTHSSGIMDHYDYADTRNMKHAYDSDVYKAIKNVDTTYFVPGTHFRYSNTAYCLLALIIEKLSGKPYSGYIAENIFKPAGMMHTTIWNEKSAIANQVTGYEWDSTAASFKKSEAGEHIFFSTEGDGGIYTSVNDYIKWYKALQSGKVFSRHIIDKARTIEYSIRKDDKLGYGFGWFIDGNDTLKKVYHSGSNSGFRTFSFSMPSGNYLVVIFSNRDDIDLEILVQKIVPLQWPASKPFTKIEVLTS